MGEVIRYSEAFKRRLVEDVAAGKYGIIEAARRRNGVRGTTTLGKRIRKYGRGGSLLTAFS
jgi:transposase-like protein